MAPEKLREFGLVAAGYAIATDPSFFQMRRSDLKDLAEPLSRREALPCVRRELVRMRSAVHVDPTFRRLPRDMRAQCNQLPRPRIDFLPDLYHRRTARRVIRRVGFALMLTHGKDVGVPGVRHH